MRRDLLRALRQHAVLERREVLSLVPEHVVDDALAAGAIARIFPGVYALPGPSGERMVRRLGALAYRPSTAISHLDGLDLWEVLPRPDQLGPDVHITGGRSEPFIDWPGLRLHRRNSFRNEAPYVVYRRGMRAVCLEQTIVDCWTLLPDLDRRVPVIVAGREGKTTGARLLTVLAENGRVAGAAEMRRVFGLVVAGCHSPLELWGHENVFDHPSLPPARCQYEVRLPTGTVFLDRFYEAEKLDVELDGAAYHGEPGQRERDNRRDAMLATMGIQAVRFSHPRLHGDPAGVRAQVLAILRMRRQQLGLPVGA